jgi:peroxiredoxin
MRKLILFLGGILLGLGVGIVTLFGFFRGEGQPNINDYAEKSRPILVPSSDAPAPAFELADISGRSISLDAYRGKVVLLNFWATWCGPCRLEMPAFQSRYENYDDELAVIAVNNGEDPKIVQTFIDELGLTFDVLLDPQTEVQRIYQVSGFPTTFIIDAEGIIRARHIGLMTEGQLDDYLREFGVGE